jgi:hypothetical protein
VYGGDLENYATYEQIQAEPYWLSAAQRARVAGPLRV